MAGTRGIRRSRLTAGRAAVIAVALALAGLAAGPARAQSNLLLYVPNQTDNDVSVYTTNSDGTLSSTTTTSVGTQPRAVAVRGDQAFAYVTNNSNNTVNVINTATQTVIQTIATGTGPIGVTINSTGTTLYVANNSGADSVSVYSVNATSGMLTAVTTISMGANSVPRQIAFSADGTTAYVANQGNSGTNGFVSVINTATNTVTATINTGGQPLGIAVNPAGTRVYETDATNQVVKVINTSTNTVIASVSTPGTPDGVVVSKDGNYFYTANTTSGTITVFNATTNTAITSISAGTVARGLALSPDGTTLYETDSTGNRVFTFSVNTSTGLLTANGSSIAAGAAPGYLGLCGSGNSMLASGGTFVANSAGALSCTGGTASFTGGTLMMTNANQTITTAMSLGTGGGTVNTNGNSTTISSVISGTGAFTKSGSGTLFLTGVNTYTGGTTVTAGTVNVTADSGLGDSSGGVTLNGGTLQWGSSFNLSSTRAISLGASAGTFDTNGFSSTVAQAITGTGSLTKMGSGTLILDGTNTYAGGTTVSGGMLEVGDASHTSASVVGAVTVSSGATLAGHGTVGGAVTNGGTVSPGGTIGTLTVSGNYTQSSAGTLAIEVAPSAGSKLAVTGSASLAGTLALTYDSGRYNLGITKYQVLTAGNGVSGTFGTTSTSGLPTAFTQNVSYGSNEIDVSLISNGAGSLASTLDLQQSVLGNSRFANATLAQHLDQAGRGVDGVFTATAAAMPMQVAFAGGAEELSGLLAQAPDQLAQYGGWFRATGTFANVDSQGSAAGFHSSAGAFLAGIDRQLAPNLVAGIAAGYGRTSANIHDDGSTATIDTPRAFLYGRYLLPTMYVDGSLGYAFDRFNMTRPVSSTTSTATSAHDGNEVSVQVQAGRPYALGWATLTPKLGVQYLHLSEDGYTETGAGINNLTVSGHDADSFRPMIGASLDRAYATDDGTRIVPEARLSYSYELLDVTHQVTEQDAAAGPTSVAGLNPGRNIVGLGTGVAVAATDRLALFADYDASLSPGFATVQTVSAGIRVRF